MTAYLTSLVSHLGNFVSVIPTEGTASLRHVPKGTYQLLVTKDGDDLNPTIALHFVNEKDQSIIAEKYLDFASFKYSIGTREAEYTVGKFIKPRFQRASDEQTMCTSWHTEELKLLLEDRVKGDEVFWNHFGKNIEKIFDPVGEAMITAIYERSDEAILQAEGFDYARRAF